VGFFTTAANAVADRRAKLAALDPNDPNSEQKKAEQLSGPDLGSQVQGLISNSELAPAFGKALQCQQLALSIHVDLRSDRVLTEKVLLSWDNEDV